MHGKPLPLEFDIQCRTGLLQSEQGAGWADKGGQHPGAVFRFQRIFTGHLEAVDRELGARTVGSRHGLLR